MNVEVLRPKGAGWQLRLHEKSGKHHVMPRHHSMAEALRAYIDDADHTCRNWTSETDGSAQIGHHDRAGNSSISWNSAHPTRGCSVKDLKLTGSEGLLYCFAQ